MTSKVAMSSSMARYRESPNEAHQRAQDFEQFDDLVHPDVGYDRAAIGKQHHEIFRRQNHSRTQAVKIFASLESRGSPKQKTSAAPTMIPSSQSGPFAS
jgi:hypothetical protein